MTYLSVHMEDLVHFSGTKYVVGLWSSSLPKGGGRGGRGGQRGDSEEGKRGCEEWGERVSELAHFVPY